MVDLSELGKELETRRQKELSETLADDFDFYRLREINRDAEGQIISSELEPFLDWSSALLRRVPRNWQEYIKEAPADLKSLIDETQAVIRQVEKAGDLKMAARGQYLANHVAFFKGAMDQTLNSVRELLLLQMIGDDRSSSSQLTLDRIRDAEHAAISSLKAAQTHASELAEMAAASQEVTAKIAASGRARIFHADGAKFERAANRWLTITGILGACLILLAFALAFGWLLELPSGADNGQVASYIFAKVLLLVTVGAAVTFTARQYAANRHNAVQNFHRSSALRTYRALLAASRDEAVHDMMLHQAAQAIFAPSDTGYTKAGTGFDNTPMVQLFQGATRNPDGVQ